jgi:hypothetical protein
MDSAAPHGAAGSIVGAPFRVRELAQAPGIQGSRDVAGPGRMTAAYHIGVRKSLSYQDSRTMKQAERTEFLQTLKSRFERNMHRHPGIQWADVEARIESSATALKALFAMERTGGEPDVVSHDPASGEVVFYDCAKQSPSGRRSICYDREARESRKEHPPSGSAEERAAEIGVRLLTEDQYRHLQQLEEVDTTTSSWIVTPSDVRERGGALFGDRRYGRVFVYHNGADSYYAARGFRGSLRI